MKGINVLKLLCVCFAFLLLLSCSPEIEAKKPIRISINQWPGYAYAFIAQEKGIFKKNAVDVELVYKQTTPESLELFRIGEVDGCFDIFADIIMLKASGTDAKIVWVVDESLDGDVILASPKIASLADLKGKTVSFEGINTFSNIFVINALERAGVKEYEVKFENIPAAQVLEALDSGRIDAGHTWDPTKSKALAKGYKVIATASDSPGFITDVLSFSGKVCDERPNDIKAIVKSMAEALDYLKHNREESLKIMAQGMQMTTDEIASGLKGIRQPGLKENIELLSGKNDKTMFSSGEMIINFFMNRGQIAYKPDLRKLLDERFVVGLSK